MVDNQADIAKQSTVIMEPSHQRWVIIAILLLTIFVAYIDRVNVSVILADPSFLSTMQITGQHVQMGLLMTLFLVAYGVSNVVLGPVGDKLGPRMAMSISIALWGLSMFVGGIVNTFFMMLLTRVGLGLGEGMHWPMQSKFVQNWFPPQERAKANSGWLFGLFLAPAVGLPFLTWVVSVAQWRATFFTLGFISLIPLVLLWFFSADHPSESKRVNAAERDYIEKGLREEAEKEAKLPKTTLWENMKTFVYNYRFWLLTLYYFSHCSVWWGTLTWLPSYLKVARGFSWNEMGAWSALPYIIGAIFVLISGWLSDKVGRRAPFCVCSLSLAAICIYGAAYAQSNIASAILISFGIGAVAIGVTCAWTLAQNIIPSRALGAGCGMMNGVSNGGSAFAPVLIGFAIAISGSYVGGLMLLVAIAVIGALSAAVLAVQGY